jgi:NAD(P)-dependent dehydrogenase (short-subunit alcohol dehydrogenase family)
MIEIDLSKKTILITGALGAIAEHIVRTLSLAGATLVLTDIRPESEALPTLDRWQIDSTNIIYRQLDVTDGVAIDSLVREMMQNYPDLDTVLGHAGGCGLHPFLETSQAEFDRIFTFNYLAQTYLARSVLTEWRRRSVAQVPHTRIPAYATAKAALECLTKCLALEYASIGIRVNAVAPGNVAAGSSLKVFEEDTEYREFVLRVSPAGRRNSPEAIANALLFLCSSLATEINGQTISVDLGVSIPKIG